MLIGVLCLAIATLCRSISELALHGKFRIDSKFWDASSWKRKYKIRWLQSKNGDLPDFGQFIPAPGNWYYRLFKIKYKERFPLSTTFLVFVTDGMHLMQFCYHLFLSASLASFSGINFFWFWPAIPAVHALGYRIFQR